MERAGGLLGWSCVTPQSHGLFLLAFPCTRARNNPLISRAVSTAPRVSPSTSALPELGHHHQAVVTHRSLEFSFFPEPDRQASESWGAALETSQSDRVKHFLDVHGNAVVFSLFHQK